MKAKILVIGQAPPAQTQKIPYDTTMLYEWLEEAGISKQQAQEIFEWEAVYDKFPGYSWSGHKVPTQKQMDDHWNNVLETKVQSADKIWVLGKVARDYIESKPKTWSCSMDWLFTIHPSKRNKNWYILNKEKVIDSIKTFINN